jgi:Protein of unknown function (DUF2842)
MPVRLRKFVGAIMLIALVVTWALLAMALAQSAVVKTNGLIEVIYYIVAGLGWVAGDAAYSLDVAARLRLGMRRQWGTTPSTAHIGDSRLARVRGAERGLTAFSLNRLCRQPCRPFRPDHAPLRLGRRPS